MADYLIGAHVGPEDPLQAAAARSADAVQIFLGNPQSWKKPEPRDDVEALERLRRRRLPIQWVYRKPGVAHPHPRHGRTYADIRCRIGGLILLPPHPECSGVRE